MDHQLPHRTGFWSFLITIDQDLAETAREQGCPRGGRLHAANYLRKPGALSTLLPEPQRVRLSFCCDRDGCRQRVTPPSVRFLGPKVDLGAVVLLISGKGLHHAECASSHTTSALTAGPSLAGRSFGGSVFLRHRSGSRLALSWRRWSTSRPFSGAADHLPQPGY